MKVLVVGTAKSAAEELYVFPQIGQTPLKGAV